MQALPASYSIAGPTSVRDRDAFVAQTARLTSTNDDDVQGYVRFEQGTANRMRPVVFRPNGSLKGTKFDEAAKAEQGRRVRELMREKKHFVPGYTGFIRGKQHIQGRTYGETTRRAFDTDFREHLCTSPIPSGPQANRKIQLTTDKNTFASNSLGSKVYHLPGYTGFVPGVRASYGRTYGETTNTELKTTATMYPRNPAREREGYAYTHRSRDMLIIDSAPLPGAAASNKAPDKLIPSHLKFVQYY